MIENKRTIGNSVLERPKKASMALKKQPTPRDLSLRAQARTRLGAREPAISFLEMALWTSEHT
jgi:hypothetical protein